MHMYPAPIPHLVIHRIGGLEITTFSKEISICVIHRIGGLETYDSIPTSHTGVIHRIGGLEIALGSKEIRVCVIHRIGGLEILLIRIVATMSELYTA